jgi:hypothetical protein
MLGVVGLQRLLAGAQTPPHTPAPVHTNGQAVPLTQSPAALQLCGILPLHCFWPVVQRVPHTPALQRIGQTVSTQWYVLSQFRAVSLTQVLSPGLHSPEQAPTLH